MRGTRRRSTSRWLVPGLAAVLALSGSTLAASPSAAQSSVPAGLGSDAELPADIPTSTLDVTIGDVVASGEVTPEGGGSISGTDDDGRIYTLYVEPGAVMDPVTVEIRPLSGSTELGPIVAGADFAPAGLELLLPALFTIEDVETPASLASFDYQGEAQGADARLVIGPALEDGAMYFVVSHFSGTVAVDVGSNANQLFDKWSATRGDDSVSGRQAAAEARYAAADLAERTSHISPETADGIKGRALEDWMSAEVDRLAQDSKFTKMVDSGDPRDLEALTVEAARILQVDQTRRAMGDTTQNEGLIKVIEIVTRYEAAMTTKTLDSKRIQDMSKSGRVSDLAELMDLFQTINSLQRQIGLLGEGGGASMAKLVDLLVHIRDGLLASCKQAPLDPSILLQFARVSALLGNEGFDLSEVLTCVPDTSGPTRPTSDVAIDGTITYDETEIHEGSPPNTWHVVVDAKIRQSGGGPLVFASGSSVTVTWTGRGGGYFDCPTSASWTTGLGSLSGEGWDALSDPASGATGIVSASAAAELSLDISTGGHYDTENCHVPGTSLDCPLKGRLTGKLVGSRPRDWSFSCSDDSDGRFVSVGGHFVQVR